TCCALSGSFQKSGAPICSSSAAASARLPSTSKIVPHFGDALPQFLEALTDFAYVYGRHDVSPSKNLRVNPVHRSELAGPAAAMFVLLAAAARTRVVAPHSLGHAPLLYPRRLLRALPSPCQRA